MRRAKAIGLAVLILLALALVPSLTVYAASNDQAKAKKFIEVAQDAYEEATMLTNLTRSRGGNVTVADLQIGEGRKLLNQANGNYTAGNYLLASENARAAQERFRDAIESLDVEEAEVEEETGHGILEAVSQAMQRIQRVQDVVNNLATDPEVQTYIKWVTGNLTEAKQNLLDAKAIIEAKPKNASDAARLLGEANRNINEASKALKLIGDHSIAKRAENFFRGLKNQLDKAKDELEDAKKKGKDVADLEGNLVEIQALIDGANSALLHGDKKAALEETKNARDLLHETLKELQKLQHGKP